MTRPTQDSAVVETSRVSIGPDAMPGLPMTRGIHDLLSVEAEESRPDPFRPGGLTGFVEWLRAVPPGSKSGLPRYMQAVWNERADLRTAFPEVAHGELRWFAWWSHLWGRSECPTFRLFGHVPPLRRAVAPGGRITGGTDVIGFFNAEHGIGEAARLLVESLRAADVPVSTLNYTNTQSRQNHPFETDEIARYRTVIAAINAELNAPMRETFGRHFLDGTHVIGQWFWELEKAPKWYRKAYGFVDELWAPTSFIADMLRHEAPDRIEVRHMPLPLRRPRVVASVDRSDLGLPDAFMFLFTFDFMSVMKRKNPLGLVEAFKRAFAPGDGPILVLKSINGHTRPEGSQMLREACGGRGDIVWRDEYMDPEVTAALMNTCDCYVSLHRSEGLGLTIAEALLLGKPVVATGYSGNMDFMGESTALAVPWTRVRVGRGAEAYSPRATWAEPDLDSAAEMLRWVFDHPVPSREMGLRAKTDLETRFAPAVTGARMRERLEEIWRQQS